MAEIKLNRAMGRERVPFPGRHPVHRDVEHLQSQVPVLPLREKEHRQDHDERRNVSGLRRPGVAMGYRNFDLTPCTAMSSWTGASSSLQFLEEHPEVEGYHFFTNFSVPKPQQIEQLIGLKKLKVVTISIYGHDLQSFVAITKSTEKVYQRLLGNLEILYSALAKLQFRVVIGHRVTTDAPRRPDSDLAQLLERFKQRDIPIRTSPL